MVAVILLIDIKVLVAAACIVAVGTRSTPCSSRTTAVMPCTTLPCTSKLLCSGARILLHPASAGGSTIDCCIRCS